MSAALPCRRACAAFGLALAATATAQAARPLQSEDAGVLDRGRCEVEGGLARIVNEGDRTREEAVQAGCGVGASTQLAVALARARSGDARDRTVAFGGKTALWPLGEAPAGAPALALVLRARWAEAPGQRRTHAETVVNAAYTRTLAAGATLHANIGHARDETARARRTTWAVALEHDALGAVAPMAEAFGDDREAPWWNLGLRWRVVPDAVAVDASYGQQFTGTRPRVASIGVTLAF